jgi:hypothetical protein
LTASPSEAELSNRIAATKNSRAISDMRSTPPPPPLPPLLPPDGGGGVEFALNVAVTFLAAIMLTLQVADTPLQSPDHPPKLLLESDTAVNTTAEFADIEPVQADPPKPQFTLPVDEVTFPLPPPTTLT